MTITIHSIDSSRAGVERFSAGIGKPLQIWELFFAENGELRFVHFWFESEIKVKELERALEWDGHSSGEAIERILKWGAEKNDNV